MLTDDMHFHVKSMKDFVDEEFTEVQQEAEEIEEGWGQNIWKQAMQFYQMSLKQYETNKIALEKIKRGDKEEDENENENEDKKEDKKNEDKEKTSEEIEKELLEEEEQEEATPSTNKNTKSNKKNKKNKK